MKAEDIERHSKGSFRELRIDYTNGLLLTTDNWKLSFFLIVPTLERGNDPNSCQLAVISCQHWRFSLVHRLRLPFDAKMVRSLRCGFSAWTSCENRVLFDVPLDCPEKTCMKTGRRLLIKVCGLNAAISEDIQLYAVSTRYPEKLFSEVSVTEVTTGVLDDGSTVIN